MATQEERDEAMKHFNSRLDDFKRYVSMDDPYEPAESDEDLGSVSDYGLDWSKVITNHRDETVTYCHLLSTGGPHEEMLVTFERTSQGPWTVSEVRFVFLPWFGRVEVREPHAEPQCEVSLLMAGEDRDDLYAFYEQIYASFVVEEE